MAGAVSSFLFILVLTVSGLLFAQDPLDHASADSRHGRETAPDPLVDVRKLDENTFILRQSLSSNFEAPFMYLLFGKDRVLMLDTGASNNNGFDLPLRQTVDQIIDEWAKNHGGKQPTLKIAHTHAHGDHFANDAQFEDRPDTQIAKVEGPQKTLRNVKSFFGKPNWTWPEKANSYQGKPIPYDLGERKLSILPIPGHEPTHIAVYDPATKTLFTGDTLYPGRLYVRDWDQFRHSVARLVEFADTHPVTQVLGAHIEMSTTPRKDFPDGSLSHPKEHALSLTVDHLRELHEAIRGLKEPPKHKIVGNDFIVVPLGS